MSTQVRTTKRALALAWATLAVLWPGWLGPAYAQFVVVTIGSVSGSDQTGASGAVLSPFVVEVRADGVLAPGRVVEWAITVGDGTLASGASTTTDASGRTSNRLVFGAAQSVVVTARVNAPPVLGNRNAVTFVNFFATCTNCGIAIPVTPDVHQAESAVSGLRQASALAPTALMAARTQATNIGLRLLALRRGDPTGSASGLSLNMDGQQLPVGRVASSLFADKAGGASADPTGLVGLGLGVFVNGIGSFGDQRASSRDPGFDFSTAGLTAGVDYRVIPPLVLGAAFGYASARTDFDAGAGEMSSRTYSVSVYGSYFLGTSLHLDAIFTYGWNDYDTERNIIAPGISATAKASPSGEQAAVSANAGYDLHVGSLTVGPSLRVTYVNVEVGRYREHGSGGFDLSVRSQTVESLTTALGGEVSYAISVPFGVLTPLVRFEWEHEYKGGSRLVQGIIVSDPAQTLFAARTGDPDRDYFNLGVGLIGTFQSGVSAFFYYETILGRDHVTNHLFTLGARLAF